MMSRPVNWSYETWPIAMLAVAVRHEIDDGKIAELVASLRRGKVLPPIFVLVDNGVVTILDGHHRVAAWVVAEVSFIPVLVGRPR